MPHNISYKRSNWRLEPANKNTCAALSNELDMPEWQIALLAQRQLSDSTQVNSFLYPTLQDLPSPFLFTGLEKAVKIIHQAMKSGTELVIVGDYDVDGVTGAALLGRFFTDLKINSRCLHPDRFTDGYGLKASLVLNKYAKPGLIISVDCGISDAEEVEILKKAGWQVIITDHHQPPTHLPPADAILNPWLKDCTFPFKDLAGVGVAFYMVMGLRNYLAQKGYWPEGRAPNLKKVLDLVAVGSIADMVKLHGVNRILAKAGLEVITQGSNKGLRELISLASLKNPINSEGISFQIGPRLNAAGRMGDAARASQLLLSDDTKQARELAGILDRENNNRKLVTGKIVNEAMVLAQQCDKDSHCLILHGAKWHEGLIGIAASKLVNHFHKPAVILTGDEVLKGSVRSIKGLNIHDLLSRCKDLLITFGGHSAAAGLSIKIDKLPAFKQRMEEYLDEIWAEIGGPPVQVINLSIDEQVEIPQLIKFNELLQPFGQGNAEPVYCTGNSCRLRNIKLIGKERNHVRFDALINGEWLNSIGFGFGEEAFNCLVDRMDDCQLAFRLQYNSFRGQRKIQLQLVDFIL